MQQLSSVSLLAWTGKNCQQGISKHTRLGLGRRGLGRLRLLNRGGLGSRLGSRRGLSSGGLGRGNLGGRGLSGRGLSSRSLRGNLGSDRSRSRRSSGLALELLEDRLELGLELVKGFGGCGGEEAKVRRP